jgi:hypothetical protein
MDWDELDALIPWVRPGGRQSHSEVTEVTQNEGWSIRVAQPGEHWKDTSPKGGDFVIRVSSELANAHRGWDDHQFMHVELFEDVDEKRRQDRDWMESVFGVALVEVAAEGADPAGFFPDLARTDLPGIEPQALLATAQCLALCEHRRYATHEPTGGRCLPARFAIGIILGRWSSTMAAGVHRLGKTGLLRLRSRVGQREPRFQDVLGISLKSGACNE